jgi:putative SOS response-associated peptidase YedK
MDTRPDRRKVSQTLAQLTDSPADAKGTSDRPGRIAALCAGGSTCSQRRETIAERFQVALPEGYSERFNLAPTQTALIVRERDGERGALMAWWGLLPHWAKDERISYKLINARAETLLEKPAFRSLLGKYRCLVVADGFYEWTVGADGKKLPIHFRLEDGSPFGFAGLWTCKTDEEGELVESCTIITTVPNELVAPVRDRMPVILPISAERDWLDPEVSREHALSLLQPLHAALMGPSAVSF